MQARKQNKIMIVDLWNESECVAFVSVVNAIKTCHRANEHSVWNRALRYGVSYGPELCVANSLVT